MNIFKDLKVIELASVLAAPSVGQFFAECGATVLKIENPLTLGDVTRSWKLPSENSSSSISAYFSAMNWGKTSLALNIYDKEDKEKLYQEIKNADIVLASYKKGDAEKLGVNYETLKKINPKLIYGHITGYGTDSFKVGYDALIQAETGFVFMNGEKEEINNNNTAKKLEGTKMPVALVDILAAHHLKEGLLVTLIKREKEGKDNFEGSYVSVSLYESALSSLANQATNWLNANHSPQKMGSEHPNIFPYGTIFQTKTDSLMLVVGNDKQFSVLCNLLNIPFISEDERFKINVNRVENREVLRPILEKAFLQTESKSILEILEKNNVPAGSVNDIPKAFENKAAQELLFKDKETGLKGVKTFVARFDNQVHNLELSAPPKFDKPLEK
ncbi:putative acyl-CoA transferase/carnitine dehydratase [Bernardetia litoralis DSM 6794]|uniref:Putative acyl-CoA transferase/carnitine dehydratase n=1 Tax=Bernardetia litoralis (strain ATCC 23117 / DSM 6794 / NBRC 15988 / NCIMB 1366 / Fx l1 / Sio-4) TaxID=880071 RepID=I4AFS2_BERLS|nr:CaiB/BaiF CoA-transferase family protein [Bernardetia litoralis]AFM02807.1 putative acyl-CoA transferase/carnitine dehydratase [Bernardetia litoralis DSM 6794]